MAAQASRCSGAATASTSYTCSTCGQPSRRRVCRPSLSVPASGRSARSGGLMRGDRAAGRGSVDFIRHHVVTSRRSARGAQRASARPATKRCAGRNALRYQHSARSTDRWRADGVHTHRLRTARQRSQAGAAGGVRDSTAEGAKRGRSASGCTVCAGERYIQAEGGSGGSAYRAARWAGDGCAAGRGIAAGGGWQQVSSDRQRLAMHVIGNQDDCIQTYKSRPIDTNACCMRPLMDRSVGQHLLLRTCRRRVGWLVIVVICATSRASR